MNESLFYSKHNDGLKVILNFTTPSWVVNLDSLIAATPLGLLELTTAPDQPIETGRFWYIVSDGDNVYGAFEESDWPIVIDIENGNVIGAKLKEL